jgi:hypothetical protein
MPRVTSLTSPTIVGLALPPTLCTLAFALFSFRQAQLLWRIPARLLGTILMLAHIYSICQVRIYTKSLVPGFLNQEIATPRQVGVRNDTPVGAGIPGAPYQSSLLQVRYYFPQNTKGYVKMGEMDLPLWLDFSDIWLKEWSCL